MVNDTPTLFQVFGPPCYTKLYYLLNLFAFYASLIYDREFLLFALFLYKITRLFLLFAQFWWYQLLQANHSSLLPFYNGLPATAS